jgi:hypothetical protein
MIPQSIWVEEDLKRFMRDGEVNYRTVETRRLVKRAEVMVDERTLDIICICSVRTKKFPFKKLFIRLTIRGTHLLR